MYMFPQERNLPVAPAVKLFSKYEDKSIRLVRGEQIPPRWRYPPSEKPLKDRRERNQGEFQCFENLIKILIRAWEGWELGNSIWLKAKEQMKKRVELEEVELEEVPVRLGGVLQTINEFLDFMTFCGGKIIGDLFFFVILGIRFDVSDVEALYIWPESRFGTQLAPSPSYKKINPEGIGPQVEKCFGERKSVETLPALLRLKEEFHNYFAV
ncbi:hypothetical protein B0H13DRAFT_1850678 [Mycena leptocephala]|nr:hypothetical protein B0H13DRAFT_1850678 [Mycena leptocephala]